ncbi:hypothetical protein OSCT_0584 [Oscillochloris trichoides DG-6]|uniref:Uncharacterized protein n=1 Tax=Oscillochloris trichoides DG-6 TaxID=765420 RepID=E1IB83_9CHLR|nr:hypothetical protein [Oscillochloris trichoides]EFO81568.1 hypothetical protein OSCT_0584 [Oscillochloris trichoides DG-6]
MGTESAQKIPIWMWGALVALLLIIISSRGRLVGNPSLSQHFALQPTPAIALPLPDLQIGNLAPDLQAQAQDLLRQIGMGKSAGPLEPVATTPRLRIEITELRPAEDGLRVIGRVTNISTAVVTVPINAFELRDSTGASYIAGGGASAALQPGEQTPLELTVPLPPGRGLLLITRLPPDPPAEQKLIVSNP